MFTPPPSPLPVTVPRIIITDEKEKDREEFSSIPTLFLDDHDGGGDMQGIRAAAAIVAESHQQKQRTARRTRWAILLVPVVLVLVALSTRHVSSFDAFDDLDKSAAPERWSELDHGHHKRTPFPQILSLSDPAAPSSSILVTADASPQVPTTTTELSQTQQTIPPVPNPTNHPALPTPFPQPFDTTGATSNVTTESCANFFTNMTQTEPFRACRPFSLLEQFSTEFIQAQTNLSALNAIVFGTCDTTPSFSACTANMNWFASSLSSSCSRELSEEDNLVTQTLLALHAYPILRRAGCLVDQTTNTYCYSLAAHSASPADLYLYQIPLGIGMPNTTTPSCSSCASSLLGVFAEAIKTGNSSADGLQGTYDSAAAAAAATCGSGYAQIGLVSKSSSASRNWAFGFGKERWAVVALGVLLGLVVLP
ncbi:hypothetical protein DFH11DRAFT_1631010 [Phellopilus nigrolimitatus]|nr:hypothetical protein DFH11DRAFT_1631010 [Phellopilus nigrolimitatus]